MAFKNYWLRFGSGDPRAFTGLNPTFLLFYNQAGSAITPPSIAEIAAGSGLYTFLWGTTTPITFLADAATTSPGTSGRYVTGALDPVDTTDWYGATNVALGMSNIALGTTGVAIGLTAIAIDIAFGTTLVAIGTTLTAIGLTQAASSLSLSVTVAGIGSTASSFGNSTTDPVDLFGYMKRLQENLEGNNTYIKGTGALSILSRGSSVLLAAKQITNSVTTVIKT